MVSRREPSIRSDYPLFRTLQTRWEDMDCYGHVNNVTYLSYFDTAINGWYLDNGLLTMPASDSLFLVVENGAHYFGEITFPQTVQAGIRALKVGTSSVTYDIALFTDEDEMACARGRYTHVLVDAKTRRPTPITGHRREKLEALL